MQIHAGRLGFEDEMQNSDAALFPKVLIPIHVSFHWYLVMVNNSSQSMDIYDSIQHDFEYYSLASGYISSCFNVNYKIKIMPNIPKQKNGYDCGVYALRFAEALLNNPTDLNSRTINPHSISNYRAIIKQNLNKARDKSNFARIVQPQVFVKRPRKVVMASVHVGGKDLKQISDSTTSITHLSPPKQGDTLADGTKRAVKICTAKLAKLSTSLQPSKATCGECKKEFTYKVLVDPNDLHRDFLNRHGVEFSNIKFCRYVFSV